MLIDRSDADLIFMFDCVLLYDINPLYFLFFFYSCRYNFEMIIYFFIIKVYDSKFYEDCMLAIFKFHF